MSNSEQSYQSHLTYPGAFSRQEEEQFVFTAKYLLTIYQFHSGKRQESIHLWLSHKFAIQNASSSLLHNHNHFTYYLKLLKTLLHIR